MLNQNDNLTSSQRSQTELPTNITTPNEKQKSSYTSIAKKPPTVNYPRKEQAIVIEALEGIQLKDYIYSVGNLVQPKNILAASRLSNGRICIYLSGKNITDDLVKTYNTITVLGREAQIRKLITPSKKLIISNVCPSIPNEAVETVLRSIGIKMTSPIFFLKVGLPGTDYAHILSFRRYVYIIPDEKTPIPESLLMKFENDDYRIFLQTDEMKCFKCQRFGHTASNCRSTLQVDILDNSNKRPLQTTSTESTPIIEETPEKTMEIDTITNSQRQETSQTKKMLPPRTRKNTKKTKVESETQPTLEEMLLPIKEKLDEEPQNYNITYETFKKFYEEVIKATNPLETAKAYTSDIDNLIATMRDLYSLLTHQKIKYRFTRIMSNIRKNLQTERCVDDYLSTSSVTSYKEDTNITD